VLLRIWALNQGQLIVFSEPTLELLGEHVLPASDKLYPVVLLNASLSASTMQETPNVSVALTRTAILL